MLGPTERLPQLRRLVDTKQYFVVHAPRQTGETTALLHFAKTLTEEGTYAAFWATCEEGQSPSDDVEYAERAITGTRPGKPRPTGLQSPSAPCALRLPIISNILSKAQLYLAAELRPPDPGASDRSFRKFLEAWSLSVDRPVVLLLDEIDALQDQALLQILRALRAGYESRPEGFPQSVALIGLRNVRDYRVRIRSEGASLGTSSPFNVKIEFLRVRDFSREEVAALYRQHEATGERFDDGAIERAYELTRGQPWLVNALARTLTFYRPPVPGRVLTGLDIDAAKEEMVLRRDTHLDSLTDRLRESRVRRVVEPLSVGQALGPEVSEDDIDYVVDLGLLRRNGAVEIANPIYREIIPRSLTSVLEASFHLPEPRWIGKEGALDFSVLLRAFCDFWLEHGEALLLATPYAEAAPHLVFLSFLHRVVNGGGVWSESMPWARGAWTFLSGGLDRPLLSKDSASKSKYGAPEDPTPPPRALDSSSGIWTDWGWTGAPSSSSTEGPTFPDRLAFEPPRLVAGKSIAIVRL